MNWHELATNPQVMTELYTQVPSLQRRDLLRIYLYDDIPRASLHVDVPGLPGKAPEQWRTVGYNVIQLHLDFQQVEDMHFTGWSINNIVDITLEQTHTGKIAVQITSPSCSMRFTAQTLTITAKSYINELFLNLREQE